MTTPTAPSKVVPRVVDMLPTKIWAEKDVVGTVHIMAQHEGMEPFDFIQIAYGYGYTDNANQHDVTQRILAMLGAAPAPPAVATEDSERERFEAWARAYYQKQVLERQGKGYMQGHLNAAWAGHQASARDLLAAVASLRAENVRLISAIRWALGYDEGEPQFEPPEDHKPRYWWRTELQRRAAIAKSNPKEGS